MSRVLRALGVIAILSVICGLLAAGSAVAADPDPMAGAPVVGACYDLTLAQAGESSAPEAPAECSTRHTMVVTAIGQLPDSIEWSSVDWNNVPKSVGRAVYATCDAATTALLGSRTRRALSLYDWFWFAPSQADVDAGARWFSCEVALHETDRLAVIPAGQPHKLGRKIPAALARCAKTTKAGFPSVACSSSHQWRAVFAKVVKTKATDKSVLRAARRVCPSHVSSRQWLYSWSAFSARAFVLRCSTKTRH